MSWFLETHEVLLFWQEFTFIATLTPSKVFFTHRCRQYPGEVFGRSLDFRNWSYFVVPVNELCINASTIKKWSATWWHRSTLLSVNTLCNTGSCIHEYFQGSRCNILTQFWYNIVLQFWRLDNEKYFTSILHYNTYVISIG